MYLAYLAGPITGCSFEGAVDWREEFIKKLPHGIAGLSPMRGKSYLKNEKNIADSYDNIALSSSRGITTRDYNDCRRASALVVNVLGATKASLGTVMEIAWAKAFNVPVILVIEKEGNIHDHAMIRESTGFRVETLDEALHILTVLLLPDPVQIIKQESIKTTEPTPNVSALKQLFSKPIKLGWPSSIGV